MASAPVRRAERTHAVDADGIVRVRVACRRRACSGRLALALYRTRGGRPRRVGGAHVELAAGRDGLMAVSLSHRGRRWLQGAGTMRASVLVRLRGSPVELPTDIRLRRT